MKAAHVETNATASTSAAAASVPKAAPVAYPAPKPTTAPAPAPASTSAAAATTSSAAAAAAASDDDDDNNPLGSFVNGIMKAIGRPSSYKSAKLSRKEKNLARIAATTGPVAPGLSKMPDPSNDPNCIELGRIVFKVRAVKGKDLQDIISRVSSHGFYAKKGTDSIPTSTYGDTLCLNNLFEQKYPTGSYTKMKSTNLKVIVEEPDVKLFPPVPLSRVRTVTIFDMLGR